MKKITLFILFILFGLQSLAQPVSGYAFAESTEVYTAVVGTNSTALGDDGSQNDIPIGFAFNYGGVGYNTFSISTNGFIRLGNGIGGNSYANAMTNAAAQAPFIAAFWDDHNRNTGAIQYNVSGLTPNKTLEIGWDNINIGNGGFTSPTGFGSFKMRLHETTGQIEFIYGNTIASAGAITASVGLNDLTSFLSVSPGAVTTVSNAAANNNISNTAPILGKKYTFMPQPQCSGTPNPGNTVSTPATVCSGLSFMLSLQNQGNGFGLTYQWQSSTNGVSYAGIAGATESTLQTNQTAATYYQCIVTCSASSATSLPVLVTMNPVSACFCFPNYATGKTDGDLISNVVIDGTTLDNNTGTDPVNPFYTYFTGQPNYTATLQPGTTYNISVTVGSYGQQNSAVWIDYNDDGVFSESEKVGYSPEAIDSNGTGTYSITLGCDPSPGVHRMRIRDVWNTEGSAIDPCATYGYGETEDYDITIVAGDSCQKPYALNVGQVNSTSAELIWSSGCGSVSWDVHVTVQDGGLSIPPSNLDVSSPFVVTNLQPSTYYEFYVRANCGANGSSVWAGPFQFKSGPVSVANDECATAYTLTPGGVFDDNPLTATNEGATKSVGPPDPTCSPFAFGGDVWFSIVVPASGNITVETKYADASPLVDTVLTLFTGDCNNLTTMACNDEGGDGAFSLAALTGLTPGSTIYARVWEYGNDTIGAFRVSAYDTSLGTDSFHNIDFTYYPNPVKNILNLSYSQDISEVKVYNLLGQQVSAKPVNATQNQIDMSHLRQGTYMVKVTIGNQVKTIKVLKE
ncbi:MAG TPA: GEVED domain-containing protein [Flavobacterium sp.]|nr:GEVED domain-containing protein [Flavobacterium sp.]